ncbi:hypothetical protein SASPL_125787 [Salvia splendens]|uniref:RING-type domain-containing protein n=1 Tax=Salvia splendens TaxID=180675 RepID=A0A8X8ZPG0_SALSN|nr:RING-H2 finger protein ATL56-like [Salvia splendens]KAG6413087.1 hypothetical protein SASPL_125787 [Salvia splendens]
MPQPNQPPPRVLSRSQRKLLLFFLKCVIMAVVMSLFLFFLGFAAIVLLNFLFMSNTFTRRRCTRLLRPAPADPEPLPDFDAFLPGVAYRVADSPNSSDCAICLESFLEGESCREIPICRHLFHSNCVDRWIGRKPNCPVCRTRVDLDPPGGDRWKNVWAVNLEEGASY